MKCMQLSKSFTTFRITQSTENLNYNISIT